MAEAPLFDALNHCIDRLLAGESLEACLRDYPEHAALLRPLLEAGLAVRAAHPAVPAGAQARVRARVMAAAPRAARRWPVILLRAAALVAVVIGVAVLLRSGLDDERRLHVDPLPTVVFTPGATASPTPRLTATASTTPSLTPSVTASATVTATRTLTPTTTMTATRTPTPTATRTTTRTPTLTPAPCTITLTASSVSLRAGPGTGYAVLGYGFAGDVQRVTATHVSGLWLQVQVDTQTYWVVASGGTLSGVCTALPVSTQPLQSVPATSTQAPAGAATPVPSTGPGGVSNDNGDDDDHSGSDDNSDDNNNDNSNDNDDD